MNLKVHYSDVYQALDDEFCFDFDPCPLDGTEDRLATLFTEWTGRRIFCNPPYGPGLAKVAGTENRSESGGVPYPSQNGHAMVP